MSDNEHPRIYNPAGQIVDFERTQSNRARVITVGMRKWFTEFAEFLKLFHLGLHCGVCHRKLTQPAQAWRHWSECNGAKAVETGGSGVQVVQTGDELALVGAKPFIKEELTAGRMEWLRQFQDVGPHFCLGVHCHKCDADIVGLNADTDKLFHAACACREFIGPNRDYREPTPAEAFYESYGKVH